MLSIRLQNQKLTANGDGDAPAVVRWLGAVQAQDYVGAKWALGLRASGLDDRTVEAAFNAGRILRTHVLRPTWHFVTPADISWMLALTGARIQAAMRRPGYKLGLTDRHYANARAVIEKSLERASYLTRKELAAALRAAGIDVAAQRLAFLVMDVEVQGIICSGPLKNKDFTYALLSERAPRARRLTRDEALAELATRFFQSHGPATLKDFAWWSGLTMRDVREATELARVEVLPAGPPAQVSRGATYLLSNYDEYLVAYKDRGAVIDPARARNLGVFTTREYPHQLVVDGRVAGSWRRMIGPRTLTVQARAYGKLSRVQHRAVVAQAERYGRFLGLAAEVRFDG